MKFIDKLKEIALALAARAKEAEPIPTDDPTPPAPVTDRYLHISKPISPEMRLASQLGLHGVAAKLLMDERGITYHSPERKVKKAADHLAAQLGMPNKARRRLRSKMVGRLHELQAGAQ